MKGLALLRVEESGLMSKVGTSHAARVRKADYHSGMRVSDLPQTLGVFVRSLCCFYSAAAYLAHRSGKNALDVWSF